MLCCGKKLCLNAFPPQYVIAYPISQGKLVNFVAFTCRHDLEYTKFNGPWVSVAEKSQFAGYFSNWEPEVQAMLDVGIFSSSFRPFRTRNLILIQCVEKPLQWAVHTVRPLRSFVSGRVALLGDAVSWTVFSYVWLESSFIVLSQAHAATPHQGSGAGQAIEVRPLPLALQLRCRS